MRAIRIKLAVTGRCYGCRLRDVPPKVKVVVLVWPRWLLQSNVSPL
jgi:hypothetical protein